MKPRVLLTMAVLALLVGCSGRSAAPQAAAVPEQELATFLTLVKSGDFHEIARVGKTVLKPGLRIPDHKSKLRAFPSGSPEPGQVRYELLSFQGDGSAGGINLFLKEDTGEIISFVPFEAWR